MPSGAQLDEVRDVYEKAALGLLTMRALPPAQILAWCNSLRGIPLAELPRAPQLEHRLSQEMMRRSPNDALTPRTPSECRAVGRIRNILRSALSDVSANFPAHIEAMHLAVVPDSKGMRRNGVRSLPDRLGNYVVFPEARELGPGLERLHGFLADAHRDDPLLAATVCMTAICNLHPFHDGNGRVSRVVFNAMASAESAALPYLPLHELGRVSRGGFLICTRLAQYRGEWAPLGSFIDASARYLAASHPSATGGGG